MRCSKGLDHWGWHTHWVSHPAAPQNNCDSGASVDDVPGARCSSDSRQICTNRSSLKSRFSFSFPHFCWNKRPWQLITGIKVLMTFYKLISQWGRAEETCCVIGRKGTLLLRLHRLGQLFKLHGCQMRTVLHRGTTQEDNAGNAWHNKPLNPLNQPVHRVAKGFGITSNRRKASLVLLLRL